MSCLFGCFGQDSLFPSVLSRAQSTEVHGERGPAFSADGNIGVLDVVLAVPSDGGETCGTGIPTAPQSTTLAGQGERL